MKKFYSVLAIAAAAMLFPSCNSGLEQVQKEKDSLQAIVDSKDEELSSLFDMLNEIEDNLTDVSAKYSSVQTLKQNSLEGDNNIKGQINAQVTSIEEMLAANKAKISELNSRIGSLGKKNAQLEEFVAKLEERVASQEAQINQLMSELEISKATINTLHQNVSDLNQNVSDLTVANQQKDETIAQQTALANRAYYIVGSYTQLKDLGIVSKTGGFIGIGKKQSTTSEMPAEKFITIDRTKVTSITINKKKAQLISKHPANSYELIHDEADESVVAYLRIINPAEFWKYTRFLVVSTK